MNNKKYQLENYRKYLLNRGTATAHITEYIENCLASEDEAAHHSFHKIMIHNWQGSEASLFDTLSEYFGPSFVPVQYTSHGAITSFYTSSLSLILKMTKLDFMFPHQRGMFNIDILFNDKTSADCFENRVTIEDVVTSVVSGRYNEKFELDLSDFSNHAEFLQKKIHFYKINLLSNFKILMLRVGRDTKSLNLSNNNLSTVPVEVLNFFIKGDLTAIDLSNNLIPSLQELHRVSSKIEKLWVEGNPLCEELDPLAYIKQILMKFPRLNELDGIRLTDHGVPLSFFRNYLATPDRKTKMIVDKFLALYFAHYDHNRKKIANFYAENAILTMSNDYMDVHDKAFHVYAKCSRNILISHKKFPAEFKHGKGNRLYGGHFAIAGVLGSLPKTLHDPTTFTIDVLLHHKHSLILIVEGVFKEQECMPENFFHFRRTFVFNIVTRQGMHCEYYIAKEMYFIKLATKEMIANSFKDNTRGTNPMALFDPDPEDINSMSYVLSHLTQLKQSEAEERLKVHDYDLRKTLKQLACDLKENKISMDKFIEEDDFSDSSSLINDEVD